MRRSSLPIIQKALQRAGTAGDGAQDGALRSIADEDAAFFQLSHSTAEPLVARGHGTDLDHWLTMQSDDDAMTLTDLSDNSGEPGFGFVQGVGIAHRHTKLL